MASSYGKRSVERKCTATLTEGEGDRGARLRRRVGRWRRGRAQGLRLGDGTGHRQRGKDDGEGGENKGGGAEARHSG